MQAVLGKRQGKPSLRLLESRAMNIDQNSDDQGRMLTRASVRGRGNLDRNIEGTEEEEGGRGSRRNRVKRQREESSDRMSRRDSDSHRDSDSEEEIDHDELNELDDKVERNRAEQDYVAANSMVLFQMLFSFLSDSHVENIAKLTNSIKSNDYDWAKDIVDSVVRDRERDIAEQNKHKETSGNISSAGGVGGGASVEGAAGPLFSQVVAGNAGASSDNNSNAKNLTEADQKQIINTQIKVSLEDLSRKKNIIIAGMSEDFYDDWDLVTRLFCELNLGHLIHKIENGPTRLGVKKQDKIRPIRVCLNNERAVDQIMNSKYDLKFSNNFYLVYINRDLSKEERENEMNIRKNKNGNKLSNAAQGAGVNAGGGGAVGRGASGGRGVNEVRSL